MINILTTPYNYNALDFIPLSWTDSDALIHKNYYYIANILFEEVLCTDIAYAQYDGRVVTKLNATNSYNTGDLVLLNSIDRDEYNGYYTILEATPSSFTVDIPFTFNLATGHQIQSNKYTKFKLPKNIDNGAALDISKQLKSKVTSNLPTNTIEDASSTKLDFKIRFGKEYDYQLSFTDNIVINGDVGFIIPNETVSNIKFKIGDLINVQQDMYESFISNAYQSPSNPGKLRIDITNATNFSVGNTVFITGYSNNPSYNGQTQVLEVGATYIDLDKQYIADDATVGTVIGYSNPQYNVTTLIVDIIQSATDVHISTTIPWGNNTSPIGGVLTATAVETLKSFENIQTPQITGLVVYDATQQEYKDFQDYVFQLSIGGKLSTVYGSTLYNNIMRDNHIHLLCHTYAANTYTIEYTIDTGTATLTTSSLQDFYFSLNLNDIITDPTFAITSGSFTGTDIANTKTLQVKVTDGTTSSDIYKFNLKDYCDVLEFKFKDQYGSYISIPVEFMYIQNVESSKSMLNLDEYRFDGNFINTGDSMKTFHNTYGESYQLFTGYFREEELDIIKSIFKSTQHYVIISGVTYECELTTKNTPLYRPSINGNLVGYKFNIKLKEKQI
jgi:hypothetical protein